jgi:hypothetical protein
VIADDLSLYSEKCRVQLKNIKRLSEEYKMNYRLLKDILNISRAVMLAEEFK